MLVQPFSEIFHYPSGSQTQLWVGRGLLDQPPLLGEGRKGLVFCDQNLQSFGLRLIQALSANGWNAEIIFCPPGESIKDFSTLYPYYSELLKRGADRHSVLFSVGGGAMGDAVGFLAGTYYRGLSWVGVPTTLLSQVDSCLGGKQGVNHSEGKNLIGVFHHPSWVLCDTAVLDRLPEREWISGLGEVFKYGLIFDPQFFNFLSENWKGLSTSGEVDSVVTRCLQWKGQIVQKDEKDLNGYREVLNFGHTLGHALEAETGFSRLRHGEAVLLGMRFAVRLSVLTGHLASAVGEQLSRVLGQIPVPENLEVSATNLLERMSFDKKAKNGRCRFVLLKGPGVPLVRESAPDALVLQAMGEIGFK